MAHLVGSGLGLLFVFGCLLGPRLFQLVGGIPLVGAVSDVVAFKDGSRFPPAHVPIRAWSQQHPGCNWRLACGLASGVWVLDVDGEQGKEALRDLFTRRGRDWTGTLTVKTARGGQLYYRWSEAASIKNSASKLAPGLDVRGDGGYVLVPPSVHPSGAVYEWVGSEQTPVASAPAWLLEIVAGPAEKAVIQPAEQNTDIAKGQRNEALFSLAGTMRRRGMTAEAIEAALLVENARTCNPPLFAPEVRAIAQSVLRYAPQIPPTSDSPRRAHLLTLSTVQPRDVNWLWRPYLPSGMLAMLKR